MYYVSIFLQTHSLLTFSGSDRYSLPTDTSLQIHTYLEGKEKARRDREGGDEGRQITAGRPITLSFLSTLQPKKRATADTLTLLANPSTRSSRY